MIAIHIRLPQCGTITLPTNNHAISQPRCQSIRMQTNHAASQSRRQPPSQSRCQPIRIQTNHAVNQSGYKPITLPTKVPCSRYCSAALVLAIRRNTATINVTTLDQPFILFQSGILHAHSTTKCGLHTLLLLPYSFKISH